MKLPLAPPATAAEFTGSGDTAGCGDCAHGVCQVKCDTTILHRGHGSGAPCKNSAPPWFKLARVNTVITYIGESHEH